MYTTIPLHHTMKATPPRRPLPSWTFLGVISLGIVYNLLLSSTFLLVQKSQPPPFASGMAAESIHPTSRSLSEIYASIREQATHHTPDWPRNQQFVSLLHKEKDTGHIVPPKFIDGLGPVGAYALLKDNTQAQAIFRCCLKGATASFVKEAAPLYQHSLKDWFAYQPSPESLHMCIVIFQEHPSLLKGDADMKDIWQPIPPEALLPFLEKVTTVLVNGFDTMPLRLDSIFWTPDGALIAGLTEDVADQVVATNDNSIIPRYSHTRERSFTRLRNTCKSVAEENLPIPLTSRPKKLIHVTLGRILFKPKSPSKEEQLHALMKRYNQQVLPSLLDRIRSAPEYNHGRFAVQEIHLLREIVWMCNHYVELSKIDLAKRGAEIYVK